MAKKQNKTTKEKSAIKRKWSSIQKEQESKGAVFLGRPEKFKTPEELRDLFNLYLASCQELVKVPKEVPKETYDRTNIRFWPKIQKISENILVTSFTISEQRKRTKIPTKLGFYLFLGGISRSTRKSYEIRELSITSLSEYWKVEGSSERWILRWCSLCWIRVIEETLSSCRKIWNILLHE